MVGNKLGAAVVAGLLILAAAPAATAQKTPDGPFHKPIEAAHGAEAWRSHQAVSARIKVTFGGKDMLDGRFVFDTPVGRSRLETSDGAAVVFDGSTAWVTPADSPMGPMARFHVLTWPYFLAAPFKLGDPGANLTPTTWVKQGDAWVATSRMTFDVGTGDAPDDWYVLYRDPKTDRLHAMAYIVTFGGKPKADAEKEPHAVVYHDYKTIDGVTLATHFTFHNWSEAGGIEDEVIGEVWVSDIAFLEPDHDAFVKPSGAAEVKLPNTE